MATVDLQVIVTSVLVVAVLLLVGLSIGGYMSERNLFLAALIAIPVQMGLATSSYLDHGDLGRLLLNVLFAAYFVYLAAHYYRRWRAVASKT